MLINELKYNKTDNNYETGYRIVYLYKNKYSIGAYCKTIEGFMIGLAKCDPIIDEDDIPKFVSTKDLLNRYLESIKDIEGVSLYNVDGTCIDKLYRQNIKPL